MTTVMKAVALAWSVVLGVGAACAGQARFGEVEGGALKTPVFTNFTSAFSPDAPANEAKP